MEIIFNEKNFTEKEADWMDAYIKKIINNCIADFLKSIKSRSENSPDFMTEDLPERKPMLYWQMRLLQMKMFHVKHFKKMTNWA